MNPVPSPYGTMVRRLLPWALALLTLAACRDFRRDNPLDPDLTPSVELSVALDDTTGTAVLSWTQYEGESPFAQYRVLRNESESVVVDTLARLTSAAQTSYTDTSLRPNTAYTYRIAVATTAGRAVLSPARDVTGYRVGPVNLLDVEVDPLAGRASLRWRAYHGPRFAAYRIERRRLDQEDFDLLARVTARRDTLYTDATLTPDTDYRYRIGLEAAGNLWSGQASGRARLPLDGVELLDVEVDPRRGRIALRWSRYRGPGFAAYRIERRSSLDADFAAIDNIEAIDDTVFTDAAVAPDEVYFYRVVTQAAGRQKTSNRSPGTQFSLAGVQLAQPQVNTAAGRIDLQWSPYIGPGFVAYRVLRRQQLGSTPTLLAAYAEVDQTVHLDTTALSGQDYFYTVEVNAAGQQLASPPRQARWQMPPVEFTSAEAQAAEGRMVLQWAPYQGPYFAEYRLERAATNQLPQVIARIPASDSLHYIDTDLRGNTPYTYRLVVVSQRGETAASQTAALAIHPRVASWPLALIDDEKVRLNYEATGNITALISSRLAVRLVTVDTQNGPVSDQVLFSSPVIDVPTVQDKLLPLATATVLKPDGNRLLHLAVEGRTLRLGETGSSSLFDLPTVAAIIELDAAGTPVMDAHPLFAETLPLVFDPTNALVHDRLRIQIQERPISSAFGAANDLQAPLDNLTLSADGSLVFADDFSSSDSPYYDYHAWAGSLDGHGRGFFDGQDLFINRNQDQTWKAFHLSADLAAMLLPTATFDIGRGNRHLWFSLALDFKADTQNIALRWNVSAADGSAIQRFAVDQPWAFFPGVVYHIALGLEDGRFDAALHSPVRRIANNGLTNPLWSSMAPVPGHDALALSYGLEKRTLSNGLSIEQGPQRNLEPSTVSETRLWQDGAELSWIGMVLPLQHQIRIRRAQYSTVSNFIRWPVEVQSINQAVGSDSGQLLFPLSLAGSDNRVYVLDAGNGRIQVFDTSGRYITQWGGDGTFDFGIGIAQDLAGSIAVDADGFIYVADRRQIQKFAP